MKKIIGLLTAISMLAGMTATTAFAADEETTDTAFVYGDVDLDGDVDMTDASSILWYYANELAEITPEQNAEQVKLARETNDRLADLYEISYGYSEEQKLAADVSGDGEINSKDSCMIMQYIISRDYGSGNIELKPENIMAINEDAQKAGIFVIYDGKDGAELKKFSSREEADKFINNVFYVTSFDTAEAAEKYVAEKESMGMVYDSFVPGKYYVIKNEEGGADVYWFGNELLKGDANQDGSVTSEDATKVLVDYAEQLLNSADAESDNVRGDICSDYNGDGSIDSLDATGILIAYAEELIK